MINICVLRSGGEYTADHVRWLAKQVPDLHCISDIPVDGVKVIPMQYDWPRWWSKMELFRPDIEHDLMFYDLDTVVLRPLDQPDVNQSLMLRDFYYPGRSGSGLMYIRHVDKSAVWDAWLANPDTGYKPTKAHHGDQGFISDYLNHAHWQDESDAEILSYKADVVRGGKDPSKADVICFHGNPRPWDVSASWIPTGKACFRDLIFSHWGKTICVMGGAPTLEEELKQVKADLYISTNGHGCEFIQPDYVLAMDERHTKTKEWMRKVIRAKSDAPIVGPYRSADIQLHGWPGAPRNIYSGLVAMWFAHALGAKMIILAGMNGYNAKGDYMAKQKTVKKAVKTEVRTTNEALKDEVKAYDPAEEVPEPKKDPALKTLKADPGLIEVEVLHQCPVLGIERVKGERVKCHRHEVAIQLKHQMVKEL